MSHFEGHFEGAKILPPKKNYIKKFLKQRDIGIFMYQSAVVYCCCVLLSVVGCCCLLGAVCEEVLRGEALVGC